MMISKRISVEQKLHMKIKKTVNPNVIKLRDDEPSRYYFLDGIFICRHDKIVVLLLRFKKT